MQAEQRGASIPPVMSQFVMTRVRQLQAERTLDQMKWWENVEIVSDKKELSIKKNHVWLKLIPLNNTEQ